MAAHKNWPFYLAMLRRTLHFTFFPLRASYVIHFSGLKYLLFTLHYTTICTFHTNTSSPVYTHKHFLHGKHTLRLTHRNHCQNTNHDIVRKITLQHGLYIQWFCYTCIYERYKIYYVTIAKYGKYPTFLPYGLFYIIYLKIDNGTINVSTYLLNTSIRFIYFVLVLCVMYLL